MDYIKNWNKKDVVEFSESLSANDVLNLLNKIYWKELAEIIIAILDNNLNEEILDEVTGWIKRREA